MARKLWKTDDELFTIVKKELFTCVVGDVMDKMRLQHQFLPPQIRPLRQDMVATAEPCPSSRSTFLKRRSPAQPTS